MVEVGVMNGKGRFQGETARVDAPWEFMAEELVPLLVDHGRRKGGVLRLWSLGCEDGLEAYALAIFLADRLGDEIAGWRIKVLSTVSDDDALELSRRGAYSPEALDSFPEKVRQRFFERTVRGFRVARWIRRMAAFGRRKGGDLIGFTHVDLVSSPKLEIQAESKDMFLSTFAWSLAPTGGLLWMGPRGDLSLPPEHFVPAKPGLPIYRSVRRQRLLDAERGLADARAEQMRMLDVIKRELNTTVVPLAGYTDLLTQIIGGQSKGAELDARLPVIAGKFTKQVQQLVRMLDDFNVASGIEKEPSNFQRKWVSATGLLIQAMETKKSTAHTFELAVDQGAESLQVFVDEPRMLKAIANLVDNAIRYGGASKRIELRLRSLPVGPGEACEISVTDDGPGIAPKAMPMLFKRFHRTSTTGPRPPGLGLGLFIAKVVVEQHDGTIGVRSELGRGSTFFVQLPGRI